MKEIEMTFNKRTTTKVLIGLLLIGTLTMVFALDIFGLTGQPYSKTFNGIEYRRSETASQSKKVIIEGTLWNPILGKSRFNGTITYDNKLYKSDFSFKAGQGVVISDDSNNLITDSTLGYLYTDEALTEATLLIFEKDDENMLGWEAANGLIFSGDAETREEAERLTDENM